MFSHNLSCLLFFIAPPPCSRVLASLLQAKRGVGARRLGANVCAIATRCLTTAKAKLLSQRTTFMRSNYEN